MTRLLLVLSTFVFTTFYATASAQSYILNGRRVSVPTADTTAANFTANSSARISTSPSPYCGDHSDSSLRKDQPSFGNVLTATSTIRSTYRNWIGPALGRATDTACYRKSHIATTCPLGFDANLGTCWAQCPFPYPVECGMECVRQNDNCALEVVRKASIVAQAAFSLAVDNVYGKFKLMTKGIQIAFKCSKEIMGLIKSLSKYVRSVKVNDPDTTNKKILQMLYQTDNVAFDIPVTIAACLGMKVDDEFKFADRVMNTAELVLKEVINNGRAIFSDWTAFTRFMGRIALGDMIRSLNESDITSLKTALESNSTCGYDTKRLLDRMWMTVAEMRRQNPTISENNIRVAMSKSNLALYEIPTVTNNCMAELIAESDESSAYTTRDKLRKGLGSIMDDLIKSGTSNNGTLLTAGQYAYQIANKVATFYAVWEKKNVGNVMSEFFQTICGPTEFVGEIDDGSAREALGFKNVGAAFLQSAGNWTRKGNGSVVIAFNSLDTEDVTVHIISGSNKVDEVAVASGKNVTWRSTIAALGGKTLYLNRRHPGFLGLPKSGGGSLLLWVPRSTQGGNLQLSVKLNVS
ncbi:unnamed protein product [Peronospora destructor]|uniref:Uncharacterized protein n=1 Tax=Peronospora destructor TaxID=86335 RepID=A0AAV0T037_9STRA|nr:unnamed protein product [Peronospora destructor]